MTYKISVIIPVYNVENYIKECLDSVINQSLGIENIEVIVVNDCTLDNSMSIVNDYAKKYPSIKIIEQEKNQGLGPTRNLGLKHVTSDYVTFLDSDDYISENAYENCLNLFSTNENTDLVIYKYELFNPDGAIPPKDIHQKIYEKDHIITNLNDVPEIIFATASWNKIYSKKLFPYLNFPSILYEDNITSVETLINSNKIIVTTDSTYYYRYEEDGSSITQLISKKNNEDLIRCILLILKVKDNCSEYEDLIYFLALKFTYDDIFWLLNINFTFEDRKEIFNNLKILADKFPTRILNLFEKNFPEYPFSNQAKLLDMGKMNALDYLIKYKFFDEYINPIYLSNLYIDVGKGFNETDKLGLKYNLDDIIDLKFNLKNFNKIKNIRFDPVENAFCVCQILSITSNNKKFKVGKYNCENLLGENKQIFTTPDPEYLIVGDFENIECIEIKFKIEILSNSQIGEQFVLKQKEIENNNNKLIKAYSDIGEKDKAINEKDKALINLNQIINNLNEEISNQKVIIESKSNIIEEMINSNSWKVTKPLRSITGTFKKK